MKPRLRKIILADWPALFFLLSIPGIWLIGLVFPLLRQGAGFDQQAMLTVALPVSLVAGGFLIWRIVRIYRLFRLGMPVTGCITRVQLARDRARVEFLYELRGDTLGAWMPLHQSREVLALTPGQEVELLVDPGNPRLAIIRHLFV